MNVNNAFSIWLLVRPGRHVEGEIWIVLDFYFLGAGEGIQILLVGYLIQQRFSILIIQN